MAYTYEYPRPAVTADCIVIARETEPKVLLIQRGDEPFKGAWAFPGGFMDMDETTEQCTIRELSMVITALLFALLRKSRKNADFQRLSVFISSFFQNLKPSLKVHL